MIQRKKNGERNRALRYLELICIDAFYVKLFMVFISHFQNGHWDEGT